MKIPKKINKKSPTIHIEVTKKILFFLNKQVWKLVNIIIILYLLILTLSIVFLEII